MKKTVGLIVYLFLIGSVQAQFRFGPLVGIAFPRMNMEIRKVPWNSSMRIGFQAGALVEIPITRDLSFQPGLQFSSKGQSYPINDSRFINSLYYLEIPLNLKFTKSIGMTDFGFFGGPYFAIASSGKIIHEPKGRPTESRDALFISSSAEDFKRFDAGLNLGICMEIADFLYSLQYGAGLMNISSSSDYIKQNRVISLSIAYLIKVR